MTQEVSMHAHVQVGAVTTRSRRSRLVVDGGILDMFIAVRHSYQALQYKCVKR